MFDFYGRAGRLAYLGFSFLAWVVLIGGIGVFSAFNGETDFEDASGPEVAIMCLLCVAFVWIALAASVRRCHDLGWSGWWVLLALIPIAAFAQGIWLLFAPGEEGENDYGPQPA